MRQRTTAKYVISSQTCLMIAVKCLRLPWAGITIDIWRWQSWTFSPSWNSWAQYMQLNLHSQYCPHVHAVPCIDLIGSFLQCHALVFNIWVTIWLWRDGRYETTNLAANCSDNTKMTTPKWQHQNSPGPIVRGAREPQKPELQNWYALTEILEASRYGVDAGTHISSLRYCHWIANLLVTQIPRSQHSPENFSAICACWTLDGDHYGLKDAKGCILEFLADEINLIGLLGVDKTFIRKSVTWALVRRLFRFSAGGLTGVLGIEEYMLVHCLAKR